MRTLNLQTLQKLSEFSYKNVFYVIDFDRDDDCVKMNHLAYDSNGKDVTDLMPESFADTSSYSKVSKEKFEKYVDEMLK